MKGLATFTDEEIWGLVYYVRSLIEVKDTPAGAALHARLDAPTNATWTPPPLPAPTDPATTAPGAPAVAPGAAPTKPAAPAKPAPAKKKPA